MQHYLQNHIINNYDNELVFGKSTMATNKFQRQKISSAFNGVVVYTDNIDF